MIKHTNVVTAKPLASKMENTPMANWESGGGRYSQTIENRRDYLMQYISQDLYMSAYKAAEAAKNEPHKCVYICDIPASAMERNGDRFQLKSSSIYPKLMELIVLSCRLQCCTMRKDTTKPISADNHALWIAPTKN